MHAAQTKSNQSLKSAGDELIEAASGAASSAPVTISIADLGIVDSNDTISMPNDAKAQGTLIDKLEKKTHHFAEVARILEKHADKFEARAKREPLKELLQPTDQRHIPLQVGLTALAGLIAYTTVSGFVETGGWALARGALLATPVVLAGLAFTPKLGKVVLQWCKDKIDGAWEYISEYPSKRAADQMAAKIGREIFKDKSLSAKDGIEFLRSMSKEFKERASDYKNLSKEVMAARDTTKDTRMAELREEMGKQNGLPSGRIYLRSNTSLWDHLYQIQDGASSASAMLRYLEQALEKGEEPTLISATDTKLFALNSELIAVKQLGSSRERISKFREISEKLRLFTGILEQRGSSSPN